MRVDLEVDTPRILEEDQVETVEHVLLGDTLDRCDVLEVFIEFILLLLDASPVEGGFGAQTCSLLF